MSQADDQRAATTPTIAGMKTQVLFERLLYGVAPAAAGASVIGLRTGRFGAGAVVFVAMLASGAWLTSSRYPLHLMPLARVLCRALAPAVGLGVAALLLLGGGLALTTHSLFAATVGTWLIVLLGVWLEANLEVVRPARLAVVGPCSLASHLAAEFNEGGVGGYEVVGYVAVDGRDDGDHPDAASWRLGGLNQLAQVVREHDIDLLLVGSSSPRLEVFSAVAAHCLDAPVRMIEAGALYEHAFGHVPIASINAAWFQYVMHPRHRRGSGAHKRVLDLALGLFLTILLLPLMAALALAVRLSDGGPAIYRQRRVGEAGREFEMLKLRTMTVDAEPDGEAVWQSVDDPRITSMGRFLRKTHLDELPQLWNLIKGDMTLVGPRPERAAFVEHLAGIVPHYESRHLAKPGITGWAQVRCGYGGSHAGSAWKTCHDLYHLKHRSPVFDALILLETALAVVRGTSYEQAMPAPELMMGGEPARPVGATR